MATGQGGLPQHALNGNGVAFGGRGRTLAGNGAMSGVCAAHRRTLADAGAMFEDYAEEAVCDMQDKGYENGGFQAADMAYTALGAVLIAVCSWISIPAAVPFTMQTFAVFFALSFLGGRRGTMAILVYVLLGAAGLPVFSGFRGGIGFLLGSTGGYIVGFLFTGLCYWIVTGVLGQRAWARVLAMVLGLGILYAFGTAWFMAVYARANGPVAISAVLGWCVLPFVIPDIAKMVLALALSRRISIALGNRAPS